MSRKHLPKRVYIKHNAFYYVSPGDEKWHRLCSVKDGLPKMHRAYAALQESVEVSDMMPAVISRWLDTKAREWAPKTKADQERLAKTMSEAFRTFRPAQVTPPVCSEYLKKFASLARTHNMHRTMLRQVLAFAALEGLRDGHNPVDNVSTKSVAGRSRIVRAAEVEAIKAAALQARNGIALVRMIDLALITGQRIGDLLALRWQDVGPDGVYVQQGKTKERLLIEWSPALRAAVKQCEDGDRIGHVLKTQSGRGYRYAGIRSSWVRACARAGVEDLNIHDLRGAAGVDVRGVHGIEAAKELLGHKSMRMTEHYTDGKTVRRVKPAR